MAEGFHRKYRPKTMEEADNLLHDLDEACKDYKENL